MVKDVRSKKLARDDKISVTVHLSESTAKALLDESDRRMISASLIVEKAVVKFLADLAPVDEQLLS